MPSDFETMKAYSDADIAATEAMFFRFKQGNCPKPAIFRPYQYVIDYNGTIGCVLRAYTTEECGHPEPYEHIYEINLAHGGKKTYYEHELWAVKFKRIERELHGT